MRFLSVLGIFFLVLSATADAQIYSFRTGANRPDVAWHQIETEHFLIVYHDGLESAAREAADVAEGIYPVVTGNLRTTMPGRTPLYLSDLDDIPNAFALDDRYMFIWMRGILDDMPLGGVRSSGHAKWFRAVITHEFTHIVIAQATGTFVSDLLPFLGLTAVPRWFNEGTARFMEPDGWTTDLDMVLRVAAVNGSLGYDWLLDPDAIDGTLLYETGHSLVRYITQRFGDSTIARILHLGRGTLGYDFNEGVVRATGMPMREIYGDWYRSLTALYGAEYAVRPEVIDIAPPVTKSFQYITGIRYSPDRRRIALLGGDLSFSPGAQGQRLHLMANDSDATPRLLIDESGIDEEFSWSPDGTRIVLSKLRRGSHRALVHDLYILDIESGSMRRLTDDASLIDPVWSPDGSRIVAVEKRMGRDNLVLVDPISGSRTPLTRFDADVQIYTPSWSPDGSRIAFSFFDVDGARAIAIVGSDGSDFRRLTSDTANNRYPVWSPDGSRIGFTSHAGGIPNLQVMKSDGSDRHFITDVAGGLYSVQWLPGADSIVAISFDTRRRLLPHLIPASRRTSLTASPPVLSKHLAWRDISFPRHVPPADSIPEAAITGPEGYGSLAHLFPVVPFLPSIAPELDRDDVTEGARFGLASAWADPMAKHILLGAVDYGYITKEWGGEAYYINNMLPFSLTAHVDYTIGYARTLHGYAYHQRNRGFGLEADYLLPAPNTLSVAHRFRLGAEYRTLEPWSMSLPRWREARNPNTIIWIGTNPPIRFRSPVNATLMEIHAGYRYTSENIFLQGGYTRSEPSLGSDIAYDKLSLLGSFRYPFLAGFIIGRVEGVAQWGEELPQEPIAMDDYQLVRVSWLDLYRQAREPANYSMRGLTGSVHGDRVVLASLGVTTRVPTLETLLPILQYVNPEASLFVETGTVWFSGSTALDELGFGVSVGAELRAQVLPYLWLSAGLAHEWEQEWDEVVPYVRFVLGH